MAAASPAAPRAAALARACFVFNGFILANIVLGALVRAHGAGLACPDWPLCFGEVIPEFDFEVAWEASHRYVGWAFGASYLLIGALVLRDSALRRAAGRQWWVGFGLLAAQGLLGALTVWQLLASWTVTSHLLTGNAWNAAVLWLGLSLAAASRERRVEAAPTARAVRVAVALVALFLVFQIGIGGLVSSRYAGLACPDWPSCYQGEWFPIWGFVSPVGVQVHHRANGYLLAAFVAWLAWAARGLPRLARRTQLALGLALAQIGVGVANVLLELPVEVTALHSALAAALALAVTSAAHAAFAKEPR
jgi:cytochrome c oxidase assembly protein subunit 15